MGSDVTDVGLEKKPVVHELKKHAASIHCSNTLSLLQRKISNALLYHAYKELMQKEEHEITIKQLCKLIAYQGNNHSAIKDALKGLLSTVIEWNVVNDSTGTEDWTASSILASVSLRGPICLFAYSPRMKELLHSPTMFGKINLMVQSHFKSSYGLALYENCIRYRGLPYTKWFDLETFRKLMGVPSNKYTVFRDFKRRVLDKSVEEVNSYSELIVDAEVCREGRQVTKIRFSLKERAKKMRLGEVKALSDDSDETLVEPLQELKVKLKEQFGLSTEQTQQVMNDYKPDFIIEKITLIEASKNYQQGKVLNLPGYLMSALKNNYQQATKTPVPFRRPLQRDEGADSKRLIEQIQNKYAKQRDLMIDEAILNMAKTAKKRFLEKFHEHAADSIRIILKLQRKKYTQETVLNSPQIKVLLRKFALKEVPAIAKQLPTIENFVENLPEKQQKIWKQGLKKEVKEQAVLEFECE
jgi:hypothetical protein